MQAHPVRAGGEQARRARPDRRPVLPPGVQHRLARGRADRAPGDLPDDDRRQLRGSPAGAGDQAAQQADQRPQDRRAGAGRVGAARTAAGQGARGPREQVARAGDRDAVPCQGGGRGAGRGHRRGHRQPRQAGRPDQGAGTVRHQGTGPVRAWSPSAGAAGRSPTGRCARWTARPSEQPQPTSDTRRQADGRDLLRRRRRSQRHPGPPRGGPRLRQPGARARAVAARLRGGRPGRAAGGLAQPGERGQRGAAGGHPAGRLRGGRPDHGAGAGPRPARAVRGGHRAQPGGRRRAVLRARAEHPLRLIQPAGRGGRVHGRPEGPGPPGAPPVRRGARRAGAWSRSSRTPPATRGRSPWPTPRPSAAPGPARWSPPSPRRPRPTCSASRPCSAAASPS